MGGDRFQEEAVLAAVKPIKTARLVPTRETANLAPFQNKELPAASQELAPSQNQESGTSHRDSSFRLAMVDAKATKIENASSAGTAMARATEMNGDARTDTAKARATEMSGAADMSGDTEISSATKMSGLESLFRQHHDRVFRTAHRVTGSAADAEDVLQTVFLRLARTTDIEARTTEIDHTEIDQRANTSRAFEWSENPEAYLSRAAINASLDLLRKRKRSRSVGMDDVEHGVVKVMGATRRNPEAHHEDRELRKLVREAVARLGEKAGAMFALRYFEGYDNGEIAQLMGTSALVVGVTLHRARARLRKEIGSYMGTHAEKGDLSA